ncbi:MAG: acyl--CoA ligase [Bauldia sp.]|nr:acyl--CoA ligase [Bauldia sp.]
MDFERIVLHHARLAPERIALAFTGGSVSYGMLAKAMLAVAERSRVAGLQPGGIVAVDIRNPFHHVAVLLGLGLRGIPTASVQLNFDLAAAGVPVHAVIVDRYGAVPQGLGVFILEDDWLDGPPLQLGAQFADEDALHRLTFSSGTTGMPKPVALSLRDIHGRFDQISYGLPAGAAGGVRVLNMMGFSTVGGYLSTLYALATAGMACFAPNAAEALAMVRLLSVTELAVTPMQLQAIVAEQNKSYVPCPSLRVLAVAGGWTSPALMASARAQLCNHVIVTYGSTESGTVAVALAGGIEGVDNAVGYPSPWVEIEIVDAERKPVPRGSLGEIRVKTPYLLRYLEGGVEVGAASPDGWFYPGDAVTMREDGLIEVAGRAGDLVNYGGVMVAPDAIEAALRGFAAITDVGVFGVKNPTGIEEIWAAVVPTPGFKESELVDFCRHRIPDRVPARFVAVAEIPRNQMGKVMRAKLRETVLTKPV